MLIAAAVALALWLALLAAPWQPWRCRERLEPANEPSTERDLTILIPAREEAATIRETVVAARAASPAAILVVDDESEDGTSEAARASGVEGLTVIRGETPPPGWVGKLWALEQGLRHIRTRWVLLLDADIRLAPGMVTALERKTAEGCALVSVLAEPRLDSAWARALLPAFVYFFKLLYPFALANRDGGPVAAAAGGVILVERNTLAEIGAFSAWRGAIIDDCTLAAKAKRAGHRTWLGLTHGASSRRRQGFASITGMVARSAYVQLRESAFLLFAATALLVLVYAIPLAALACPAPARWLGAAAWAALAVSYLPTLRYYRRNPLSAIALPATAMFYLGATWYSALRTWSGTRSAWKGRRYTRSRRTKAKS